MILNKPTKIILGILTFLPLLFTLSIIGLFIVNFFSMMSSHEPSMSMRSFSYLSHLLPLIFPAILLSLGLFIFYVVHMLQNVALDTEKRMLWIIVTFIAYGISLPIYWYLHVWKNDPQHGLDSDPIVETHHEPRTDS